MVDINRPIIALCGPKRERRKNSFSPPLFYDEFLCRDAAVVPKMYVKGSCSCFPFDTKRVFSPLVIT